MTESAFQSLHYWAARLRDAGHEAVHVTGIGMLSASDDTILKHAAGSGQVIVSADADFGELLAVAGVARPSVVLLRSAAPRAQAAGSVAAGQPSSGR